METIQLIPQKTISIYAIPGIRDINVMLRRKQTISINQIRDIVSEYFNIPQATLVCKTRKREVVEARQTAMYMCLKYTKHSLAIIGNQIGEKDHATVIHARKTIINLIDTDKEFSKKISDINELIKQIK